MAEIIPNQISNDRGIARAKKQSVRIDMTPMVDLGFLLITFFIFTTTIGQPSSMSLIMPKEGGENTPIKESGALTLLPTEGNKIYYYQGMFNPANLRISSEKEIRSVIADKKRQTPEKNFFVVIKPSDKADYQQVVDILDEMTILDVKRYAMADITKEEQGSMIKL